MQIMINIPKEFENHFNLDNFEDSLQRIRFDIHKAIIANKDILSGNYEIETLDMPKGHGRLFDEKGIVNGNYEIIGSKIYELEPVIGADKKE